MSMYPEASSPIGSPYTPAGGNNMGGGNMNVNPNQMGIGGNTGSMAPVAQQMQGMGRGEDSMLIHMTPGEVGGLQALAQAHGGSLTINPHTGLPEAGFLSKLLPTLLGFGLNFFLPGVGSAIGAALGGIGSAAGTAVAVGAGTAAVTGDLKEGLMAGLGAFGGASLGTSALAASTPAALPGTAGSAIGTTATTAGANNAALNAIGAGTDTAATVGGSTAGLGASAANAGLDLSSTGLGGASTTSANMGLNAGLAEPSVSSMGSGLTDANMYAGGSGTSAGLAAPSYNMPAQLTAEGATPISSSTIQPNYLTRLGRGFVDAANNGAKPSLAKTGLAAAGIGVPIMEAFQPAYKEFVPPDEGFNYEGPYRASKRYLRPDTRNPNSSGERMYFDVTNPMPGFVTASGDTPSGYASGGATKTPQLKPADIQAAVELARSQYIPRPDDYVIGGPQEHDYGFRPMSTFMPKGAGILDRGMGQGNTPSSFFGRFYDEEGNFAGLGGRLGGGSANDYYLNPETGRMEPKPPAAAAAGMHLKNGSFIVDARTVSELGNGSSRAGQDFLAKFGGHALHGPGDGVSDSIHANIGGTQEARVARDEVKFDPEAVARLGGGNASAGTKKLYALMAKAEKARKSAKRGQDTGLRAIMGS